LPLVGVRALAGAIARPFTRGGDAMVVKIARNDRGNPPGKLAEAELHFTEGVLDGLKLIGFGIWERRNGSGRNVTFPARQYSVNGERRSFALLRPIVDATAQERLRELILEAYQEHEERAEVSG
jgi:hypothetical protein